MARKTFKRVCTALTWPYGHLSGMLVDNLNFISEAIFLHNLHSSISHGLENLEMRAKTQ